MRFYRSIALLSFLTILLSAVPLMQVDQVVYLSKDVTFSQEVAAQSQIEGDKPPSPGSNRPRSFASSYKTVAS